MYLQFLLNALQKTGDMRRYVLNTLPTQNVPKVPHLTVETLFALKRSG